MSVDPFFRDLEAGIDRFNRREYFEAHEVWEDRWNEEAGDSRRFLQGLIQVAAGLYKLQCRAPPGAVKLLGAGIEKLKPYGERYCGVDLRALAYAADHWRRAAEAMLTSGNTDFDPNQLPAIAYARPDTAGIGGQGPGVSGE